MLPALGAVRRGTLADGVFLLCGVGVSMYGDRRTVADSIPAVRNSHIGDTDIPVTPTHPIERVTVAREVHELPVPKSPEVVSDMHVGCHNDENIDCDLFPGVTAFRRRFN